MFANPWSSFAGFQSEGQRWQNLILNHWNKIAIYCISIGHAKKNLFGVIKLTNQSVWMAYKGQSSFRKPVFEITVLTYDSLTHRKVTAGRSSVPRQMASVFLSDNISLFTNFAQAEDMITTSHSKWPIKRLYIMYHVNYMPILVYGSSCDGYK